MSEHKDFVRAQAKRHRNNLKVDPDWAAQAAQHFFDRISIDKDAIVSVYYPTNREIDTSPIVEKLWADGLPVCLPVVRENSRVLSFVEWRRETGLVPGVMGILEPFEGAELIPDILLIPLLAFDQVGYRLGYGKGYYDATIKELRKSKKILCIGLAYSEQACILALPRDEYDEPLDLVITPQRVFDFQGRKV